MTQLKHALIWLRSNASAVFGALAAVFVGVWLWGLHKKRVGALKDAVGVEKAKSDVVRLKTQRDAHRAAEKSLEGRSAAAADRDKKLEVKINAAHTRAVKARESVEGKSAAEIADRFNQLFD
jgi:hypothetical protein